MRSDRDQNKLPYWSLFRKLIGYILSCFPIKAFMVLALVAISSVSGVAATVLFKFLIDGCLIPMLEQSKIPTVPVAWVIGGMAAVYFIGMLCSCLYRRMIPEITRGITKNIRVELFSHMERLPIQYFDTYGRGAVLSIFTNDTDTLRQLLGQSIPQLTSSVITIAGTLIGMFWLNPVLAAITASITGLLTLLAQYLTKRNAYCYAIQQEQLSMLNDYMEEMLEGQLAIKLFSGEEQNLKGFESRNALLKEVSFHTNIYSNMLRTLMTDGSYAAYIAAAAAGLWMIAHGQIEIGALASFLYLSRNLVQPVSQISGQVSYCITALAGAGRIFQFLEEDEEADTGSVRLVRNAQGWNWVKKDSCCPFKGDISFLNVQFYYERCTPVIKNLSFSVKSGNIAAIAGPTGAGKTSILQLLNRLYDPISGSIQIDNVDLSQVRKSDIRKAIGVVTQDTWLFSGTIKENIAYGKQGLSDEEVIQAAKKAQAHDFIMALPDGYKTMLADGGKGLSEGQRQLLSIARVIAADPPLLLLDEATSSLDTRTERLVQESLKNLMQGRTTFIVAHRLATVSRADCIIVLKDGEIAEIGSHEALLNAQGIYAQMCKK